MFCLQVQQVSFFPSDCGIQWAPLNFFQCVQNPLEDLQQARQGNSTPGVHVSHPNPEPLVSGQPPWTLSRFWLQALPHSGFQSMLEVSA